MFCVKETHVHTFGISDNCIDGDDLSPYMKKESPNT
jgi:hypothetical protein